MQLALQLARRAAGQTSPNPMVGAVVVKVNRVIGQGYHRRAGLPHAEIEALHRAGTAARHATLYVTLEPCNHYGRTLPCCDAIIASGISHVVVASRDPNPITNGRGLKRLRQAGIRVTTGILEQQASILNAPFFKAMRTGLPWVIAKIGQSLDGRIATRTGQSRWITHPQARRFGHRLRAQVDAILVGCKTVQRDNPLLSARISGARSDRPVKVVVDSHLHLSPTARCFSARSAAASLVATTVSASEKKRAWKRRGIEVLVLPARHGRVPLRALCRALVRRGLQSVLIEGGGEVLASAFEARLVDRAILCVAPILIGGRDTPGSIGGRGISRLTQAIRLEDVNIRRLGPDFCVEGKVVYPKRSDQ